MKRRVVITGIGITCCLGEGKEEVRNRLDQEVIGLRKQPNFHIELIKDTYFGKCNFDDTNMEHYEEKEKIEHMAIHTIKEAIEDSLLSKTYIESLADRAGLSLSSSLAGIDHIMKAAEVNQHKGEWLINSRRFTNLIMNEAGIKGTCYTTSSACAAGTAGIGIGYDLICNDDLDLAVVGGVDNLSLFSIFGFYSLKTLCRDICKPFDKERSGINLGEGACFFILEELEHALARRANIYGEILGYGLANDAYHITSPDPEGYGAIAAMKMAINEANIDKNEKIYINAHGTATKANDSMEIEAIKKIWDNDLLFVSSSKSRTGHCLGAAGSIELAISLFSIKYNKFYPTLNSNLDILESYHILKKGENTNRIRYALSNSLAFAGNTASILISDFSLV